MLENLGKNIIYGKTNYVCEHLEIDGNASVYVSQIKESKGEIIIDNSQSVSSINQVKSHFQKIKAALLIINNNQVLQKEVLSVFNTNEVAVVNQAFPNIDLEVFFYEILWCKEKAFVFICRKQYLDELIEEYEKEGIFITHWSLGVTSFQSLLPFLSPDIKLQTPLKSISLVDGNIDQIYNNQEESRGLVYDIDGLEVKNSQLNSLGAVLKKMGSLDEKIYSNNYSKRQLEKQSYYKQHRLYAIGLPAAIGLLLLIFLVNFLCYNFYYEQVSTLSEIGDSNVLQKQLLVTKDSIVSQKQKLFEDVIESSSSSSSFYIDQVILKIPESIQLEKLDYRPLLKKIKDRKAVLLDENTILISGSTAINNDISNWISIIEKMDFIDKVSITKLDKNGDKTSFTLELKMKEN